MTPGFGHRVCRGELDFEPGLVAALIAPDRAHAGLVYRGIILG